MDETVSLGPRTKDWTWASTKHRSIPVKLWIPVLALTVACGPSPSSQPDASATVDVARAIGAGGVLGASGTADATGVGSNDGVVSGWLSLTKGAQPVIGGRMLGSDTMAKFFGKDWRDLKGRRFRVYGEKHDHKCDPGAQCMLGGVIPGMRNVTHVELCQGCATLPANVKAVECTPDKAGCVAICEYRGELCRNEVASNAEHIRRCDSQVVGCRKGCQLHGTLDPDCL